MNDEEAKVLLEYFRAIQADIGTQDLSLILQDLACVSYSKNSILARQGDPATKCFLILKGCLRLFFVDELGNDHTSGFFSEKDVLTIMDSYRFHRPSPYGIECLEDCLVVEGDLRQQEALTKRYPQLGQIIQQGMEVEIGRIQDEESIFRALSPQNRYLEFLKRRPGLAARIPQFHLASFLGMKPESLSRIKRRLYLSTSLHHGENQPEGKKKLR